MGTTYMSYAMIHTFLLVITAWNLRPAYSFSAGVRSLAMSTANDIDAAEIPTSLKPTERLGRALSFYSAAIPLFASYKSMEQSIKFRREVLNRNVTEAEEAALFERLHDWGSDKITNKINELKGFYVKTGQIISTRVDIFPEQYTSKLAITQDGLDSLSGAVVKDVVRRELLGGAALDELFSEFDEEPLGSASIAQVHRARLLDGRQVAVKVQRPGIEAKLLGDIQNLKNFARLAGDSLLIDYYKIFCEIEKTLVYELDFLHEAQATTKIASAVAHSPKNQPQNPPVTVPLPIPGLVTRRVMVMEYVEGKALSKIAAEMTVRGVESGSPESQLLGNRLLSALTDAYAAMIFGSGIIHGDPHPGNIFVLEEGGVALLDCGQVKQISTYQRLKLARLIVLISQWEKLDKDIRRCTVSATYTTTHSVAGSATGSGSASGSGSVAQLRAQLDVLTKKLAAEVRSFGVQFKEGAGDDCAAAVALVLFGNTGTILPGGYVGEEISPQSPIPQVSEFPSEFILLGRATVMIKGISNRLGLPWGLSDRWSKWAQQAIDSSAAPQEFMPIWSVAPPAVTSTRPAAAFALDNRQIAGKQRLRSKDLAIAFLTWVGLVKAYVQNRATRVAKKAVKRLPEHRQRQLLRLVARVVNFFSAKSQSAENNNNSNSNSNSSSTTDGKLAS